MATPQTTRAVRLAHTLVRAEADAGAARYVISEILDAGDSALTHAVITRLAEAARLIAESTVARTSGDDDEGAVDELLARIEAIQGGHQDPTHNRIHEETE